MTDVDCKGSRDEASGSVENGTQDLERENSNVKREFLRRLYSRDKSKDKLIPHST